MRGSGDSDADATREPAELSTPGVPLVADDARPRVRPGEILAERYRIVRLLGRGGAGDVHEAIDQHLGTSVALKLLHHTASAVSSIERLRQELLLARKVSHPSVCRVFDVGLHEGLAPTWFITMELLGGESLRDRLQRRGRLPLADVSPILDDLIAGLAAAHAVGVIHRDLTPANIFLVPADGRERAVITDFGLAVSGDQESPHLRAAGTPAYMAPEQVEGQPATPATDVFALGVVLFEALTGELPWKGRTAYETAALRLSQPPIHPCEVAADLPARWGRVLLRCLARDPSRRFATMAALAAALATPPRKRVRRIAAFGATVTAVAAMSWLVMRDPGPRALPPVVADPDGAVAMAFAIGGGSPIVEGVIELADGDVVIAGHTFGPFVPRGVAIEGCRTGRRCGYVMRLSSAAEVRWTRILSGDADVRCHGPVLAGDQLVVGGELFGSAGFAGESDGPRPVDAFVLALDLTDGAIRWFRRLGAGVHVRALASDADRNVFVTGDLIGAVEWAGGAWRRLPDRPADAVTGIIAAFDPQGVPRWARAVEGRRIARFLALTAAGDDVLWGGGLGGESDMRGVVLALDRRDGTTRWSRDIGGAVYPTAAVIDGNGGALIAGHFTDTMRYGAMSATSAGESDGWAARIELASGEPRWLTRLGGEGWENVVSVGVSPTAVWLGGRTKSGFVDGALSAPALGGGDAYVARLDPDGVPHRAWSFGGDGLDKGRVVAVGPSGVWFAGNFQHVMTAGDFVLHGDGINDGFVMRLAASAVR